MIDLSKPINLASKDFNNNKYTWYERIREERPVGTAKISLIGTVYTVARHDDCEELLKHPNVLRNRSNAIGGSRLPFPVPNSIKPLVESMIVEDDPNHRRLRELVRRGFRPQAIEQIEKRIDSYSQELLEGLSSSGEFDLQSQYALPIPVRMIGDMLGVSRNDMPRFQQSMSVLSKGFSGWRLLRTLFFDLPTTAQFVRELVRKKKHNPGDDILTALIQADDEGDRLTEDELVAMVFLLILAGFETTVHLITNGVLTLLQHPEQLERLRAEPELFDSAVEEILRFRGPVQSTKPGWASEDITLRGVTIPKGKPIMPLFGAANHDPRVFDNPAEFDVARSPNKHLGFGHGVHFCLGAHLARAETKLALRNLIDRFPNLKLGVDPADLKLQLVPGWHRYQALPVASR